MSTDRPRSPVVPMPSNDDLAVIVADVCTAIFGVAAPEGGVVDAESITAWAGTTITTESGCLHVVVGTDDATERRLASVMFSTDHPTVEQRDAAVRELVNIVGGNVKGAIGVPATLSLPRRDAAGLSAPASPDDLPAVAAVAAPAADGGTPIHLVVTIHPRAAGAR